MKACVDDRARLVRAAAVDCVAVGHVGCAFSEGEARGEEEEDGEDGLEGELHGWLICLMERAEGKEAEWV